MRTISVSILLLLFYSLLGAQNQTEEYTVSELVNMALHNRPLLKSSSGAEQKSEHLRKAVRSAYGPTVVADAELMLFNDDYNMQVVSDDPLNLPHIDPDIRDAIVEGLQTLIKPLPVRDQFVFHAGVTVMQPLTRIYTIYQQDKALEHLSVHTKTRRIILKRAITYNVTLAALAVLEAEELVKIAGNSVSSLKAIAIKTRSLVSAGSVGEFVALEAESALAIATAEAEKAKNIHAVASAVLARTVGAKALTISTVKPITADPPAPPLSLVQSSEYAATHFPELKMFQSTRTSSQHKAKAIRSNMFPHINLVAHYDFRKNIYLVPENEFSVGLNASWELLSWGRRYHLAKAAESSGKISELNRDEAISLAKTGAYTAWLQLNSTPSQIASLKSAVAAAEASFKAHQARFDAGEGVMTELILAHNRLQTTKALATQTRYQGWRNFVTLKMKLGNGYSPMIDNSDYNRK
ncbi:TolC family protein [bacterium]|nr:TolC family protein [bacterium]